MLNLKIRIIILLLMLLVLKTITNMAAKEVKKEKNICFEKAKCTRLNLITQTVRAVDIVNQTSLRQRRHELQSKPETYSL